MVSPRCCHGNEGEEQGVAWGWTWEDCLGSWGRHGSLIQYRGIPNWERHECLRSCRHR